MADPTSLALVWVGEADAYVYLLNGHPGILESTTLGSLDEANLLINGMGTTTSTTPNNRCDTLFCHFETLGRDLNEKKGPLRWLNEAKKPKNRLFEGTASRISWDLACGVVSIWSRVKTEPCFVRLVDSCPLNDSYS